MSLPMADRPIHFSCTGCGKCCTGESGFVWVTPDDIQGMAEALDLTPQEFADQYLRKVGERYSLREVPGTEPDDYDCILLEGKLCRVYTARPVQCRTFPFWPANLESKAAWKETKLECEGIHPDADLVPREEVHRQLAIQEQAIRDSYLVDADPL